MSQTKRREKQRTLNSLGNVSTADRKNRRKISFWIPVALGGGYLGIKCGSKLFEENPENTYDHNKTLSMFDSLNQQNQKEVLSRLEKYLLGQTFQGGLVYDVISRLSVPEMESPKIPENKVMFDPSSGIVYYGKTSNMSELEGYLNNSPQLIAKAHERLHYAQYIGSKASAISNFEKAHLKVDGSGKLTYDERQFVEFCAKMFGAGKSIADYNALYNHLNKQLSTHAKERLIIDETTSYLSLQPFDRERLHNKIAGMDWTVDSKTNGKVMDGMDKSRYFEVFDKSLEILSVMNVLDAAVFVRNNGNNFNSFISGVSQVLPGLGYSKQKNMDRQSKLVQSATDIRNEAVRVVSEAYSLK